jgi:hypothetical protein
MKRKTRAEVIQETMAWAKSCRIKIVSTPDGADTLLAVLEVVGLIEFSDVGKADRLRKLP